METAKLEKRNPPQKDAAINVATRWQQVFSVAVSLAEAVAVQLSTSLACDFARIVAEESFSGAWGGA